MIRQTTWSADFRIVYTSRLLITITSWHHIVALAEGYRLQSWAPDYPADGDSRIAKHLFENGEADLHYRHQRWKHRLIIERNTGVVAGGIGFKDEPSEGTVELGYGVVPSKRGQGYANEAVEAMVTVAWTDPRVDKVVARTEASNLASIRVLESNGFTILSNEDGLLFRKQRPAVAL